MGVCCGLLGAAVVSPCLLGCRISHALRCLVLGCCYLCIGAHVDSSHNKARIHFLWAKHGSSTQPERPVVRPRLKLGCWRLHKVGLQTLRRACRRKRESWGAGHEMPWLRCRTVRCSRIPSITYSAALHEFACLLKDTSEQARLRTGACWFVVLRTKYSLNWSVKEG